MNKKILLYAPTGYTELTPKQKRNICNGCGAKGGIPVPNTFYGLDIKEACQIHDYMYHVGKTHEDKVEADRVFKINLTRIINAKTSWCWLRRLRHNRRDTYCYFVEEWGMTAYWEEKNDPEYMVAVA